jgi:hypothetical protein
MIAAAATVGNAPGRTLTPPTMNATTPNGTTTSERQRGQVSPT